MIVKNISASFYPFFGIDAPDTQTTGSITLNGLNPGNQFDVYSLNVFSQVSSETEIQDGVNSGDLAIIWNGQQLTQAQSIAFVSSMGTDQIDQSPAGLYFADYNDATTASTPITLTANTWTDFTNDGAGPYSNTGFLPSNVTQLLDTSTGYLDLSQLELGDAVIIRNDFTVTTRGNRANLNFRYSLGTGAGSYTLDYFVGRLDSGAGIAYHFNLYSHYIYLGDDNTRLNPIKLQLHLSKNGFFTNNGSAIQVLKK